MATDPYMTDEQKKRLRRDQNFQGSPLGMGTGLYARPSQQSQQSPGATPAYQPTAQQRGLARQGVLDADAELTRQRFAGAAGGAAEQRAERLNNAGASRLYRGTDANGNTVFTDQARDPLMAGAGEERFYGADGIRLDEGLARPGEAADVTPGRGRAAQFSQDQAAFYDQLDSRNEDQVAAIGRRQPDVEKQLARNEEYRKSSELEGMMRLGYDPTAIARATGANAGGGDVGDMIRLMQLQETKDQNQATNEDRRTQRGLTERTQQRQELSDLRKFIREDPDAYLREELGMLRGQDEGALDEFFGTERGRLLRSALDDRATSQYTSSNAAAFGLELGLDKPRGLGDLVPQGGLTRAASSPLTQRYATPTDQFQQGLSLEQLGLQPGDDWLLEYMARRQARE